MTSTARHEGEMKKDINQKLRVVQDPIEKLRLQCLARGGCGGIKGLSTTFHIIDDSGNKTLDLEELTKGVRDYGLNMSKDELTAIFQSFDKNRSGTIDFNEFLIALRPPMSKSRQDIVMLAFKKLDKSGDGIVKVDDMEGVYNVNKHPQFVSGERTKEQLFKEFLKSFEAGGNQDGIVTKDEFFSYYSGVSASIDSDVYFDLMMRNAWKL